VAVDIYPLPKIHSLEISILLGHPDASKELIQKHQPNCRAHRKRLQRISAFCLLWNRLTLEGWWRARSCDVDACKHRPKFL